MIKFEPTGKRVDVLRLNGPMVKIGTFRQGTDVVLSENGTSCIVAWVDIPLKTFLGAIIHEGIMPVEDVNKWIDKKNEEWEKEQNKDVV